MIVKIKTNEPVDQLYNYLIEQNSKRSIYTVKPEDLTTFFKEVYEAGILKCKIEIESDDYVSQEVPEKMDYMQYLEFILKDDLEKLETTKNVKKFLKKINFEDKDNIVATVYKELINADDMEVASFSAKTFHQTSGIYFNTLKKVYGEDIASIVQKSLSGNIKGWLEKNHPEYKKYITKAIPYTIFLKFLLKHTGYKYY